MQTTAGSTAFIIGTSPPEAKAVAAKMPDPKQNSVRLQDLAFRAVTCFFAFMVLALLLCIIASLVHGSLPAIAKFGWGFLVSAEWNPVTENFGALVPIVGTLLTSAIALAIGVPVSFGIALFLTGFALVFGRSLVAMYRARAADIDPRPRRPAGQHAIDAAARDVVRTARESRESRRARHRWRSRHPHRRGRTACRRASPASRDPALPPSR